MQMRLAGVSVPGGRPNNQDAYHAAGSLVVVADGVGGAPAGDVASSLAVATVVAAVGATGDPIEAARQANAAVRARAAADPQAAGMATTLDVALLREGHVLGAHVGDSVVFVEGKQITRPHSLADELVAGGHLTPAEAARHPQRHALVRAIGLDDHVNPDTWARQAVVGERYLLCTDGLTNALGDSLGQVLSDLRGADPATCASMLVRLACEAGASDNVTVVVADIV